MKILFVFTLITLTSCGNFVFREINCRPFKLSIESYWFPKKIGESVTFIGPNNESKTYSIVNKYSSHVEKYITDTGCGCENISGMLLVSDSDSLFFMREEKYIEDNESIVNNYVTIEFNGNKTTYSMSHHSTLDSLTIDSSSFENIWTFTKDTVSSSFVKTVYLINNLGIGMFELRNGDMWRKNDLVVSAVNNIENINLEKYVCD